MNDRKEEDLAVFSCFSFFTSIYVPVIVMYAHAFRISVYSAVLLSDVKRSINKSVVELIGKTLA